ncbi:MAG: hypothetical protein JXQ23_06450 [Clostridia bacterium]|nr:hypothetical protein [Clostridia bacterium]
MEYTDLLINKILSYETMYIIVLTFSLAFLVYVILNVKKSILKELYISLSILLLVVLLCNAFILISSSVNFTFTVYLVKYIAISVTSVLFINFVYFYNNNKFLHPVYTVLLSLVPLFTFLAILTNPIHLLFFSTMNFKIATPGILFYINSFVNDILLVTGLLLFTSKQKKTEKDKKKESTYFMLLMSGILLTKSIYNLLGGSFEYNVTVALANIAVIIFGYVLFVTRFFDIEAYGIDEAINNLKESVVILNREKKIIAVNKSFETLVKKAYPEEIKESRDLIKSYQSILDKKSLLPNQEDNEYKNIESGEDDNIYLNVVESSTYDKDGNITGFILIFRDISEYIEIQEALQIKNIELTKTRIKLENHINDIKTVDSLEKRNRLAKELHDILGHTLTVTNLKLQYCINNFDNDIAKTRENINEIKTIVEKGINQLSISIDAEEVFESVSMLRLRQELLKLASSVSSDKLSIEITVKGVYKMIPVKYFNTLYRICQEALTNTLRHSHAENVYIIIRADDHRIDLNIFDDGSGCTNLLKGNGLSGMEQRITELNGKITFKSVEREGFYIKASIPIIP